MLINIWVWNECGYGLRRERRSGIGNDRTNSLLISVNILCVKKLNVPILWTQEERLFSSVVEREGEVKVVHFLKIMFYFCSLKLVPFRFVFIFYLSFFVSFPLLFFNPTTISIIVFQQFMAEKILITVM